MGHVQKRVGYAFITLCKNPPIEIVEIVVKKAIPARKATKRRSAVEPIPAVTKQEVRKVRIGGKNGISKNKK